MENFKIKKTKVSNKILSAIVKSTIVFREDSTEWAYGMDKLDNIFNQIKINMYENY